MNKMAHNHQRCVEDAMESAEKVCSERGARLTPLRRRVLELVWESHEAIKAYDLLDRLGDEAGSAKPPTVYRALDFLMEQGLIHRIESANAYVGCRHPETRHDFQLLICDECRHVEEIESDAVTQALRDRARAKGFEVSHQTVEVHGRCPACRNG